MSYETQIVPDVAFLLNTGAVLLSVTIAAGAIGLGGTFLISTPGGSPWLSSGVAPTTGSTVMPPDLNIEHN